MPDRTTGKTLDRMTEILCRILGGDPQRLAKIAEDVGNEAVAFHREAVFVRIGVELRRVSRLLKGREACWIWPC